MKDIRVLFVDDEPLLLSALQRNLIGEPFSPEFANSGAEALEIMAKQEIQVIVSDMKMPEMDGLELLRQVKEQYPETIRLVFSGFTHIAQIIPCINSGDIFRYITKPLEPIEFKQTLQEAISFYLLRRDKQELVLQLERQNAELKIALDERKRAEAELLQLSLLDALTGIPNRRSFDQAIEREWQRARRSQEPLSLLMIDIDFFKGFNDRYGHPAGDECLQKVAAVLRRILKRPADLAARYGGEEFVILLPDTSQVPAIEIAKGMRSRVEALAVRHESSAVSSVVTISIGIATLTPEFDGESSLQVLITQADTALYLAKDGGRNRVGIYGNEGM